MDFYQELNKLNKEQLQAVQTSEGYIRTVAGAGSGKTSALTMRYAYLIKERDILPDRILCVTFTNKAADEMKSRVISMVGEINAPYIMTFHGFCNRFLREEIHSIGWDNRYKIIDTDADIPSVLKVVYEKYDISNKDIPYSRAIDDIIYSGCKSPSRKILDNYEKIFEFSSAKALEEKAAASDIIEHKILLGYLAEQLKDNLLDYEDLLNLALYILKTKPHIREKWQNAFDYIQVDEFQDVSRRELELVSILSDKRNNLFVVGDGDQSIYSFRGSDVDCINNFEKHLSWFKKRDVEVQTIILNRNYRSTPEILNISNRLIRCNRYRVKKDLVTDRSNGAKVVYCHTKNVYDEGEWIAKKILSLSHQYKYSDIAVLYRMHSLSKAIEDALINYNIPYKITSGIGFYQRKEIKFITAVLSLAVFDDDLSFSRVINELSIGIGKKKLAFIRSVAVSEGISHYEALKRHASDKEFSKTQALYLIGLIEYIRDNSETTGVSQLIDYIITYLDLKKKYYNNNEGERYENLIELKRSAQRYEKDADNKASLEDYLNTISLYSSHEKNNEGNKVTLMTVHAAKGLEFPVVFVIGFNEGIMPNYKAKTVTEFEEERRIGYVALTRAKDLLFITDAEGINYDETQRIPSRFLMNIGLEMFEITGEKIDHSMLMQAKMLADSEQQIIAHGSAQIRTYCNNQQNVALMKVGDRVNHEDFGNGTIIGVLSQGWLVKFDNKQVKGISSSSKKLKKITA